MTPDNVRRLDRLAVYWLCFAGYVIALLMAIVYWQLDQVTQRLRRQSREQFQTIQALRHEASVNDEAAKECEAKAALTPNQ